MATKPPVPENGWRYSQSLSIISATSNSILRSSAFFASFWRCKPKRSPRFRGLYQAATFCSIGALIFIGVVLKSLRFRKNPLFSISPSLKRDQSREAPILAKAELMNKSCLVRASASEQDGSLLSSADKSRLLNSSVTKPQYSEKALHEDMRQVAGYARLEKVYKDLDVENDKLIDCLIIYPKLEGGMSIEEMSNCKLKDETLKIKGYNGIYKLGITLPVKDKK